MKDDHFFAEHEIVALTKAKAPKSNKVMVKVKSASSNVLEARGDQRHSSLLRQCGERLRIMSSDRKVSVDPAQ